jgi:hypothetical protein
MATTATGTKPVHIHPTRSVPSQPNLRTSRPSSRSSASDGATGSDDAGPAVQPEPVCVSADVAFRVLGVGRTAGYKAINDGTFPVAIVRIGRIIRVPLIPLRRALGISIDDGSENDRLS